MIGRRRFISIIAGAGLSASGLTGWRAGEAMAFPPTIKPYFWKGIALGAPASLTLVHDDAERIIERIRVEITRLESIFSLYSTTSYLSRLNAEGQLKTPPFELLDLLSLCGALHTRTNGAFDPTVQPLWALYADKYSAGHKPSNAEIRDVLALVGWKNVHFDAEQIVFETKQTKLTLNGIAQGYITDKIAQLLRSSGVPNVLINIGEIAALGHDQQGKKWQVGIANPSNPDQVFKYKQMSDLAIATSAPLGTAFDPARSVGHILDPRTGRPGNSWQQVSVIAPRASTADGLSTAFCLMTKPEIQKASVGIEVEILE